VIRSYWEWVDDGRSTETPAFEKHLPFFVDVPTTSKDVAVHRVYW